MALETRRGWKSTSPDPSGRDETAFDDGVQTLEETGAENPDIGKNATAAKPRKAPAFSRSQAPH